MRRRSLKTRLFWTLVVLGVLLLALGGWVVRGAGTALALITQSNSSAAAAASPEGGF